MLSVASHVNALVFGDVWCTALLLRLRSGPVPRVVCTGTGTVRITPDRRPTDTALRPPPRRAARARSKNIRSITSGMLICIRLLYLMAPQLGIPFCFSYRGYHRLPPAPHRWWTGTGTGTGTGSVPGPGPVGTGTGTGTGYRLPVNHHPVPAPDRSGSGSGSGGRSVGPGPVTVTWGFLP